MFRNYLACALRNLTRHRLHTAITTLSLAVGFTAAIMAALLWRYETTYDRFWPNAERIYLVAQWDWDSAPTAPRKGIPLTSDAAKSRVAGRIKEMIAHVETVARLSSSRAGLSHDGMASDDDIRWADPEFLKIFQPRAIAGDLSTALTAPNSVVLTQSLARHYFGDTAPVGQTLALTGYSDDEAARLPVRVTAVIADFPANTHLEVKGLVSAVTSASPLNDPTASAYTYVLARSGTPPTALEAGLGALNTESLEPGEPPHHIDFKLLSLPQAYMKPAFYGAVNGSTRTSGGMNSGSRGPLITIAGLAGLILAVAAINFITLMTSRGSGRAVEVGVRKACGARRHHLVLQFIGEAVLHAAAGLLVAFAAIELLAPLISTLSRHPIGLDYRHDLGLLATCALLALAIGGLAGAYPAFALSAYRPAAVLKGGLAKTPGSARLRHILLTVQFLPLIILAVGAVFFGLSVHQSTVMARKMLPGDPLLIFERCTPDLKAHIEALPGVASVTCTSTGAWRSSLNARGMMIGGIGAAEAVARDGKVIHIEGGETTLEVLRFHFGKALAGRLFSDTGEDSGGVVINETAARNLGYTRPADAVGQAISWRQLSAVGAKESPGATASPPAMRTATIIGLVADRGPPGFEVSLFAPPGALNLGPPQVVNGLGVRLSGADTAGTLAAIDKIWADTGAARPIIRTFYSEEVANDSRESMANLGWLGAWIGVGMTVACLGLFGLAAFLAEQRTKEIGVRKAMGAGRSALLRMLLFQFVKPVLIANLIACPLMIGALYLLQASQPVASRVHIGPEVFAVVLAGSLLIALGATFTHAWRVTGARPVTALRYE